MSAGEIARLTSGELHAPAELRVNGPVVADSRQSAPDGLYVAIVGARQDGHDFADQAHRNGAVLTLGTRPVAGPCVVVRDPLVALGELARAHLAGLRDTGRDARHDSGADTGRDAGWHGARPIVVAITGSVGKTTTKDLIAGMLAPDGEVVAPAGSLNNELGLPLTVLRCDAATRYLIAEMGADRPGDLTYLTSIAPPDIAVVLAVGRAHLEGFGSLDAVAQAKGELVRGLRPGGTAVLNAGDPRVAAMAALTTGPIATFDARPDGSAPVARVVASDVRLGEGGHVEFIVHADGEARPVRSRLVGAHHASNLLAAATVGLSLGLDLATVASRLGVQGAASPHRMAVTTRADSVIVIDDTYNANPESMRAALAVLAALPGVRGRRVAVLGTMCELGEYSDREHRELGAYGAQLPIDLVLGVGDGGTAIAEAARQAGISARWVADSGAALAWLTENLGPGDAVLLKASNSVGLHSIADAVACGGEED